MVYFILGILILLLPFMTPKSIRGTLNSVTMVVLIVLHYRPDLSRHFQIFQLPSEFLSVPF